ncbi:MAG TPA: hypothetical protein VF141_20495 [Chryseolinea sp.]
METQKEIPLLKKSKERNEKIVQLATTSCCAPKSNASVCCTPNEAPEDNSGSCCTQPLDGSACCDK